MLLSTFYFRMFDEEPFKKSDIGIESDISISTPDIVESFFQYVF